MSDYQLFKEHLAPWCKEVNTEDHLNSMPVCIAQENLRETKREIKFHKSKYALKLTD
jgi:hypothetical protein